MFSGSLLKLCGTLSLPREIISQRILIIAEGSKNFTTKSEIFKIVNMSPGPGLTLFYTGEKNKYLTWDKLFAP